MEAISTDAAATAKSIAAADLGRRRGRPTREEVAAISRAILAAAKQIFQDTPFEDVSIEAIAERGGVKRNTVYKRFPDKRGVLRAVLVQQVAGWALANDLSAPAEDLAGRLKGHAARILLRATSAELRIWTHLAEVAWPGIEELGYRRRVLGYDRMVDILHQEIEEASREEGLGIADARFVATALMSILTGWMDTIGRGENLRDDEIVAFAHAAVDLVMQGCAGRNNPFLHGRGLPSSGP
jgi:AcrR family transcriptional regulator